MRKRYDFFLERANYGRGISLNMAIRLPDGIAYGDTGAPLLRSVASGITFKEVEPDYVLPESPFLSLSRTDAQTLMDELWRCGLRPSEGSGSAGAMAATQLHLKDMQTIAFELLERSAPDA